MGLMTLGELANYLRVTKKTIYRLLERNSIPAKKVGHQWRFDRATIDVWLQQGSAKTAASILVIDDDEAICSLFRDTLEETRYSVTTVSEPSKGIELVKDQNFDLVILDLKMPGINGVELLRQIKIVKPKLPVTIITAYPDSNLMMGALALGPLGIMNKPFSSSDIMAAVNNHLRLSIPTE